MGLSLLDLDGLRALVTGAGTGLGRQMALGLAEAGADLVVCGRRLDVLESCAAEARALGVDAEALEVDVTVEESVVALKERAGRVDVLVNNAGVSRIQSWETVSMAEWRDVMALNLDAPFRLCQLFAPAMVERRWGRIINISSMYGHLGGNVNLYPGLNWDLPAYFPSKHGLNGITHYLATRLAPFGVCVNSISPGAFRTPGSEAKITDAVLTELLRATPMNRLGGPQDLQAAVVFLASPGAGFVTGQNLSVDGGFSCW